MKKGDAVIDLQGRKGEVIATHPSRSTADVRWLGGQQEEVPLDNLTVVPR